jgi:hypothetical protein
MPKASSLGFLIVVERVKTVRRFEPNFDVIAAAPLALEKLFDLNAEVAFDFEDEGTRAVVAVFAR